MMVMTILLVLMYVYFESPFQLLSNQTTLLNSKFNLISFDIQRYYFGLLSNISSNEFQIYPPIQNLGYLKLQPDQKLKLVVRENLILKTESNQIICTNIIKQESEEYLIKIVGQQEMGQSCLNYDKLTIQQSDFLVLVCQKNLNFFSYETQKLEAIFIVVELFELNKQSLEKSASFTISHQNNFGQLIYCYQNILLIKYENSLGYYEFKNINGVIKFYYSNLDIVLDKYNTYLQDDQFYLYQLTQKYLLIYTIQKTLQLELQQEWKIEFQTNVQRVFIVQVGTNNILIIQVLPQYECYLVEYVKVANQINILSESRLNLINYSVILHCQIINQVLLIKTAFNHQEIESFNILLFSLSQREGEIHPIQIIHLDDYTSFYEFQNQKILFHSETSLLQIVNISNQYNIGFNKTIKRGFLQLIPYSLNKQLETKRYQIEINIIKDWKNDLKKYLPIIVWSGLLLYFYTSKKTKK